MMRYLRSSPIRILLLEAPDNPRRLLCGVAAVEITRSHQTAEALLRLEAHDFDVLLVDLEGLRCPLLDTVRTLQTRRPGLPTVVALAREQDYLVVDLMRQGIDDYVIKGSMLDDVLVRWLLRSVEQCRLQDELESAHERARRTATQDPVTGLGNRSLFYDTLTQAIAVAKRYEDALGVVYIDVDCFKAVNSAHGHAIGDGLLRIIGERIRASVRESDFVARIGGDDFVLLLRSLRHQEDAGPVVSCILSEIAKSVAFVDQDIAVTASAGIALYPADGITAPELVQHAELAMYTAKGLGRNTYQFFSLGSEPRLRLVHDRDAGNF